MKEAKRLWSWLAIPCIALAVLTGSILPVLLVRGFYTVQIGPLGICEASGLTRQQAAEAYGDVMDYCLGRRPDFAAGVLPFSAEGASHFADVRGLFLLAVWVFVAAAAAPVRGPDTGFLGGLRAGRTLSADRPVGGAGFRPGLHGVPQYLFPRQGQLAL